MDERIALSKKCIVDDYVQRHGIGALIDMMPLPERVSFAKLFAMTAIRLGLEQQALWLQLHKHVSHSELSKLYEALCCVIIAEGS